mgnify:CR=1 FL=1
MNSEFLEAEHSFLLSQGIIQGRLSKISIEEFIDNALKQTL